jgi:chromosome segregation ATPase
VARQKQQELTTGLEEARRKAATLQGTASVLDEERQIFAAQRAELESQVAASAKTATQLVEQSAAELAEYRASLDTAKQALAHAQERASSLEQQLSAGRADRERLCARVSEFEANAQQTGAQIEQLKQRLESTQEEAEDAVLKANRGHEEEASRARRELGNLLTERDNLAQQRDELLRRLSRISEEQKRLLDNLASTPQVMPPPSIVEERPPANIIEVNIPEVLPPESGNGIAIPRVRAMSIPPPKVHTL